MTAIAVIDYGMGNLRSVEYALAAVDAPTTTIDRPRSLEGISHVVLPGVGAFGDAMALLADGGWVDWLHEVAAAGVPLLGICLGMQVLATEGLEHGRHQGLGLIDGTVRRIDGGPGLRVPHIGWNDVSPVGEHPVIGPGGPGTEFYFVHSYVFDPADPASVVGTCSYGRPFAAAVASGSVLGVQFHPEKSQHAGLALLARFARWAPC